MTDKNSWKDKKGVALIIALGILALIALIGTSFAVAMLSEYRNTSNLRNGVKARYLAEMGINRAIGELLYGNSGAQGRGMVYDAIDSSTETWATTDPYPFTFPSGGPLAGSGYTVNRIRDCASQIYINDNNPNLPTILANLNTALGSPLTGGDLNQLMNGCPYITKEQIRDNLTGSPADKQTKYNAIRDFITVYAFVDPDVISTTNPYPATPRAPINVNTAPREVLIAVLTGLSTTLTNLNDPANYFDTVGISVTLTITSDEAAFLADRLISGRPYTTYDQLWQRLLDAEKDGLISDGDAAVVMANANPNTDLMRCNPNYTWLYKHLSYGSPASTFWTPPYSSDYCLKVGGMPSPVDKTMITGQTTEFCFNSGGYYEITATGSIRDSSGTQVATKSLQAIVKLFDIWRQTTQAQFYAGTVNPLNTLEFYPEYDRRASGIPAATYDGQITLSALRSTTPNSSYPLPYFRKNFSLKDSDGTKNDFNASASGGDGTRQTDGYPNSYPREASVIASSPPGHLFPDGVFFHRNDSNPPGTTHCFYPDNNISPVEATVEIWVKPNFIYQSKWNMLFPVDDAGKIFEAGGGTLDLYYARAWTPNAPATSFGVHYRLSTPSGSARLEYGFISLWLTTNPWKVGTWHHIVMTWDYLNPSDPTDTTYGQVLYIDSVTARTNSFTIPPGAFPYGWRGLAFGHTGGFIEPPNSTFDEIRIFPTAHTSSEVGIDYAAGRYYDVGDAYFESSSFTPNATGSARLGTISWTEHTTDPFNLLNTIIPGADIQFDVFDGSNWIGNYTSRSDPAGNSLNLVASGTGAEIRYRAYLTETALNGIRDTPLLDDVTITYLRGVQILYMRDI